MDKEIINLLVETTLAIIKKKTEEEADALLEELKSKIDKIGKEYDNTKNTDGLKRIIDILKNTIPKDGKVKVIWRKKN